MTFGFSIAGNSRPCRFSGIRTFCTYSVGDVTYLVLNSKQSMRDGYVRVTLLDIR